MVHQILCEPHTLNAMKIAHKNFMDWFKPPAVKIIVLAALGFLLYFNSLGGGFVWDDSGLIAGQEEYLEDLSNLPAVFFKPNFEVPYHRPLLWASFFFDYSLWGLKPIGFHITNVALHIINTGLVYWFIVNLGFSGVVAFFAAALFASHPVQTEAISWIAGRNDPLLVLFLLFSFNFLLVARKPKQFLFKITCYSSAVAAFACALLTKESAIIALPLLILTDVFYQKSAWRASLRKETIALYASFILVSCCFFILRSYAIGGLPSRLSFNFENLFKALTTPLAVYTYYFKVLLFPLNLTVGPAIYSMSTASKALILLTVFSWIALVLVLVRNALKETLFGMLWIGVYLLPVSGLVWMGVPILEHRLYGASIGFCLMLAALCCNAFSMLQAKAKGVIGYGILVALIILYGYLTIDRNRMWKDDVTIWTDTLKKSPKSVTALNNLANALIQEKQFDRAITHLNTALKLNPRADKIYGNLGLAYSHKKDYSQAIKAFEMALKINPRSAETYNNMALVYKLNGNIEAALISFQKALALKPQFSTAYLNRGELYLDYGDKARALADYQRALQLSPHNSAVHYALGLFYAQQGATDDALAHYQKAINFDPSNYQALNNISRLYSQQKAYDKALPYQAKALAINPDAPELHLNLGLIYFNTGKINEAIEEYRKALGLNPAYIEAHFNIATAYLCIPDGKENARYHFNQVLTLQPDHPQKQLIIKTLSALTAQSN